MFLDPHDSHLDARVDRDGLTCSCMHDDGFQYLWKGVRANFGIKKGVYMYEIKVLENNSVKMPETKPINQNIARVGFSQPLTSLFLGDTAESWGWGGTGKKSHNNNFADYGGQFKAGDVIGCVVDMEQGTISYTKNGQFCGVAFDNVPAAASHTGMFPHILLKNVKVKVNFSRQNKWFDPPGPEVKFFDECPEEDAVANPVEHPESMNDAEFILLAGLPACGKTYWAQKHMEANPQKAYVLLGTNAVIDQMKVMNLNRQRNYADRWEELISQATPIFNKLVEIAGKTPRNIILDQTNVYPRARGRKAAAFQAFGTRICVCIVNDEATLAQRTEKREREEGKFVPEEAVYEMRANFTCPELKDGFTALMFPELPEKDSRQMIKTIADKGWEWKRRNPGAGKGNQPKSKLEGRDASSIGKGAKGKGSWDDKPQWGRSNDRSRSPRGHMGNFGGGWGGKGWGRSGW